MPGISYIKLAYPVLQVSNRYMLTNLSFSFLLYFKQPTTFPVSSVIIWQRFQEYNFLLYDLHFTSVSFMRLGR